MQAIGGLQGRGERPRSNGSRTEERNGPGHLESVRVEEPVRATPVFGSGFRHSASTTAKNRRIRTPGARVRV